MMNFWKRSGQKEKCASIQTTNSLPCNGNFVVRNDNCTQNLGEKSLVSLFTPDILEYGETVEKYPEYSKLSKSLHEVLQEQGALGYFVQYLDSRGALAYVKFWLDVESFRSSVRSSLSESSPFCININRYDLESESTVETVPSTSHDSLSISTDCDSFTADSTSIFDDSYQSAFDSGRTATASDPLDNKPYNCDLQNGFSTSQCDSLEHNDSKQTNQNEKLQQALVGDAVRIFKKYILPKATYYIRCPEEMRNSIATRLCNSRFDGHCFDDAQNFAFQIMERDFYSDFLRSNYYCKHQVDVLTSGNVGLSDILYNETALFYFMEFLEQEQCRDLLEFWIAIINFRHNLKENANHNLDQIQGDAIILYDKYFSLQATSPLGFPDSIRFDIEQNICHENGPQIDCFDKPIKLVEIVLEKNFLKLFLTSQLFFKYLSELISTIQTSSSASLSGRHRRIGSDTSSEISSISAHNTLLAMEDHSYNRLKNKRKNGETDMSIDTRHLYDPDSLWRRKKNGGLSLGRVNELGRFERAIEPEPDRKSESKLGLVMKKLVNIQEDKAKEEMAWQIAEMIVKDITSLTLSESPPHNL